MTVSFYALQSNYAQAGVNFAGKTGKKAGKGQGHSPLPQPSASEKPTQQVPPPAPETPKKPFVKISERREAQLKAAAEEMGKNQGGWIRTLGSLVAWEALLTSFAMPIMLGAAALLPLSSWLLGAKFDEKGDLISRKLNVSGYKTGVSGTAPHTGLTKPYGKLRKARRVMERFLTAMVPKGLKTRTWEKTLHLPQWLSHLPETFRPRYNNFHISISGTHLESHIKHLGSRIQKYMIRNVLSQGLMKSLVGFPSSPIAGRNVLLKSLHVGKVLYDLFIGVVILRVLRRLGPLSGLVRRLENFGLGRRFLHWAGYSKLIERSPISGLRGMVSQLGLGAHAIDPPKHKAIHIAFNNTWKQ